MFIIDMSFHSVIVEYFKKLDISLVVVKSLEKLSEKDLPKIQTTHYYEKDIVFETKAKIDESGTIVLDKDYKFIFNEKYRKNEDDIFISKCNSLIFLWKIITPEDGVFYTYKKVTEIKDDILILKENN